MRVKLRRPVLALCAAASLAGLGCGAPANYDRGRSLSNSAELLFGNPSRDVERLREDFAEVGRSIEEDARNFPRALEEFGWFFY